MIIHLNGWLHIFECVGYIIILNNSHAPYALEVIPPQKAKVNRDCTLKQEEQPSP